MYTNLNVELTKRRMSIKDLSLECGIPYTTLLQKLRRPNGELISIHEAKVIRKTLGVNEIPVEDLFAWEE